MGRTMRIYAAAGLVALAALMSAGWTSAEDALPSIADMGYCADVRLVQDFDVDKFLGTWYLQREVPNPFAEAGRCTAITFSREGTDMIMSSEAWSFENERISREVFLNRREKNATTPYYVMMNKNTPQVEYNIVDTDYVTYACTYTCFQIIGAIRVELFFETTREAQPAASALGRCDDFFYDNYIETAKLNRVDQTSDVCSVQWRQENLPQIRNLSLEMLTPSENHDSGHPRSSSSAMAGTGSESKLEDLSAQAELEDPALTRNDTAFLKSEKETDMIISLLEDDREDEFDHGPASGSSSGLIPGGTWQSLFCFVFILNFQLFLSSTNSKVKVHHMQTNI